MGRFDHLEIRDPARSTLSLEPETDVFDADSCLEKARRYFATDAYERALSLYSRALQYDLNLAEAWAGQIRCLTELNELPEAITWSMRAMERLPNASDILAARAVASGRAGRMQEAMGFLDGAFALRDVGPFVWVARGDVLLPSNSANARACFLKAIEMAPRSAGPRRDIARACIARGVYQLALEHLRAAAELEPEDEAVWFWTGTCHERLGEPERTWRAYRRALEIDPRRERNREALRRLESMGAMDRWKAGIRGFFHRGK